jgi:ABC-type transporter Mla subunit MlaD
VRIDRRSLAWSDVRRGATQLCAVVAAAGGIFFMDEARLAVESGAKLMLVAQEAGELRLGGSVWVAGKQAGKVTGIRFVEGREASAPNLEIRTILSREAAAVLRRDASATIEPSGLLAPFVVSLDPGSSGQAPYDFSDTLQADVSVAIGAIAAFGDSLSRVLEELKPVVTRLRQDIRAGSGTLEAFSGRGGQFSDLQAQLAGFRSTLATPGSIERLVSDTTLAASLRRSGDRLERLAERASAERPGRGVGASMRSLAESLQALHGRLETARGSAGRALHDREIQDQARLFRARVDTVRVELARQPFSWLRIRLF